MLVRVVFFVATGIAKKDWPKAKQGAIILKLPIPR